MLQRAGLGNISVQRKLCCILVYEEIEFSQLIFREDFLRDSYFGGRLHGQIATEELHFGEGVHRRAFRSKVLRGLTPVFKPGHACVLKVHNAVAYGTRNNDELIQRNYRLAAQVGPPALGGCSRWETDPDNPRSKSDSEFDASVARRGSFSMVTRPRPKARNQTLVLAP